MLSLDCFDALLWRNVHAPKDIFTEIAIAGGGVEPRAWAQGGSQRLSFTHNKTYEVSIEDIYRRLYRFADDAQVAAAVAHELSIEARHCYPFAPVIEIGRAHSELQSLMRTSYADFCWEQKTQLHKTTSNE